MMVMQIEEEGKTASEEELKEMFRYMDKFVVYKYSNIWISLLFITVLLNILIHER